MTQKFQTRATAIKFIELKNAYGFLDHAAKPMDIVLGDDGYFWVVLRSDAQRLEKAGYTVLDWMA